MKQNQLIRFLQILNSGRKIVKLINQGNEKDNDYKTVGPLINKELTILGPTFIKLGQMLSLRPDIIPSELADEFRDLLDHGIEISYRDIEKLFQKELGKNPNDCFDKIEKKAFAVASLAQVHRAELEGKTYAVKFQKPGIKDLIHQDLKIALRLSALLKFSSTTRDYHEIISEALQEFFSWIDHELDYRLEALNISRTKKNYSKIKYFKVPDVKYELSTKKILTMEFIEGVSLNELFDEVPNLHLLNQIHYKNINFNKETIIKHETKIIFKQVIEDGFFHADPHPANVIITPDNKIAYIDFGVVGSIPESLRKKIIELFMAISSRNVEKVSDILVNLDEVQGHDKIENIQKNIRRFINKWQSGSVLEMTTAEAFFQLLKIALRSDIQLPLSMIILGKTMLEYDGSIRRFKPELDLIESFKPLALDFLDKGNFSDIQFPVKIKEMMENIEQFPEELRKLIKNLDKEGIELSLKIDPEHKTTNLSIK